MGIFSGGGGGGAPSGAAGGDLSGTYPNPAVAALAITNAKVAAAAAIGLSKLADPTTGKVLGSASNAAAAVFPPGYELAYAQITSTVLVVSTTEASGTTIIAPGAITFDGTPVCVEFFAPAIDLASATGAGNVVVVSLFEGATQIGRLCIALLQSLASSQNCRMPGVGDYRFTPTAGAHTYTITAYCNSTTGGPQIEAGSGGTGTVLPAFVRFTKV